MPIPKITAPEGRTLVAIGPQAWGKGPTAKEAVAKMRTQLPRYLGSNKEVKVVLVEAPADAYVDDIGYTCWKQVDGVKKAEQVAEFTITRRR